MVEENQEQEEVQQVTATVEELNMSLKTMADALGVDPEKFEKDWNTNKRTWFENADMTFRSRYLNLQHDLQKYQELNDNQDNKDMIADRINEITTLVEELYNTNFQNILTITEFLKTYALLPGSKMPKNLKDKNSTLKNMYPIYKEKLDDLIGLLLARMNLDRLYIKYLEPIAFEENPKLKKELEEMKIMQQPLIAAVGIVQEAAEKTKDLLVVKPCSTQ